MKHKKSHSKKAGARSGSKRGKSRRGRSGKRGLGKAGAVLMDTGKDLVNPLGIILGYAAGAFAGRMLDKVDAIKPDATKEGFQIKSLIKPAALLVTGIVISAVGNHLEKKGKNKAVMTVIKNFGYGVIVSGGVALVKGVIKKDLFDGLGNAPAVSAKYLQETKDMIKQLIEQNGGSVELPPPSGDESVEGMGDAVLPFATLQYDDMSTII